MRPTLAALPVVVAAAFGLAACAKPLPTLGRNAAGEVTFSGMCDASAAVALSDRSVLVADDEDNVLRAYDADRGGAPTTLLDLSALLELPAKPAKEPPEVDIEAAARIGDRAYFVTSHGRNSRGKPRPERLRFFALSTPDHGPLGMIGEPYRGLLRDLVDEPKLATFALESASELSPKAPGGLNIEGMTARAEGGVWLGFRNPIPRGLALLVPLLNPQGLVASERASFGDPVLLDLGGLGVRALARWHGQYLIAAGPFDGQGTAKLFAWSGSGAARELNVKGLDRYNPEAFFAPEARAEVLVLSDDGSRPAGGVECKKLKDPSAKHFRALWLKP